MSRSIRDYAEECANGPSSQAVEGHAAARHFVGVWKAIQMHATVDLQAFPGYECGPGKPQAVR